MEDSKQHVIAISLEQERFCVVQCCHDVFCHLSSIYLPLSEMAEMVTEREISYHLDIF